MDEQGNAITPADIKVRKAEHELVVTWKDGRVSHFDLTMLRKRCPCATCNEERSKQPKHAPLLPILSKDPGKGPPQVVDAGLVGNYALHIKWSDGHDTGIYDFRFLRALDEESRADGA